MNTDGCAFLSPRLWVLLVGMLLWGAAGAQGWPALEQADFAQVGGGQHDAAVLIGIDDYAFLGPVVGAEANIAAWERWLLRGRKVPYQNVKVLRGKGVRRSQVQEAAAAAARAVGAKGTVYVVFVGHGAPANRPGRPGEAHLLLGNTDASFESFGSTGVGVESDLPTWLQPATAKGAKVVAVLDACFTGKAQGGDALIPGAQFAVLSSLTAPANLTLLTAASSKDITGPLPGAARPAFSYLVLAALRGWGDANRDGQVSAQEAVNFAAGVMLDAQRPERPALSGADVDLGKSGGEVVPAYRNWLGRSVATVRSVAAPQIQLGEETDLATLARQAQAAQQQAEASRQALAEAEARRAAEQTRQVAQAQTTLDARVRADFESIRGFVERPSEAGRPVLEAFVKKYGVAAVSIDGVQHALSVPEVARVQQALAASTGGGGSGGGSSGGGHTGIEWVRIEGGSFSMGSKDGGKDEGPRRQVRVPSFHLAKTEVTLGQYRKCVEAGACPAPNTGGACNWGQSGREDHPVNCVSWDNAQSYAKYVDQGAHLPTEAEWEYAARSGGREQQYPWGNAGATCRYAMMDEGSGNGCDAGDTTAPVCSKPSGNSAQGVCDLAGNVWEWVDDWYGPYADAPTDGSARSGAARYRVLRGGGWFNTASYLRAASRHWFTPGFRYGSLGFRLAR